MTEQEKQLWAQVINDSRWYDGTPQGMVKLSEHLNELFISERDKFAIEFAVWIGDNRYTRMSDNRTTWWGREWLEHQTTSDLLDLYKQSLTKTEQR